MNPDINIVGANLNRQIQDKLSVKFQRQFHLTHSLIKRLGLIHKFEGHRGCVNCLEWHESGEILASGSDDCNIIIWNPYTKKTVKTIASGHQGNIFSVKFIKTSSGNCIASGAADHKIRVHDVVASECTFDCICHSNRVKRLATPPSEPYVFMSAAEDGLILQFDLREKHICPQVRNNVLINLTNHIGPNAEAKCLAINPLQPELIAIGANDPYVRLYDRRMITLSEAKRNNPSSFNRMVSNLGVSVAQLQENEESSCSFIPSNIPLDSGQYFIAGHLRTKRKPRPIACTYLSFNSKGSELLANLGCEQIYLFDIKKLAPLHTFHFPTPTTTLSTISPETSSNGTCKLTSDPTKINPQSTKNGYRSISKSKHFLNVYGVKQLLPPKVQALKEQANEYFDNSDYINAVSLYNLAIIQCPNAAVLYGNRAIALMKRSWDGDVYAALRDCSIALELDSEYFRAHFRMARCLCELKRFKEAYECFEKFKLTFPEQAKDHSCIELEKQISENLETSKERWNDKNEDALNESHRDDCLCASGIDEAVNNAVGSSSSSSSAPRSLLNNYYKRKNALSEHELVWRAKACDFKQRFCGHCNTTTDIKEANFFGRDDQFIIAGSDDGNMFIWDRSSSNIVRVLKGDYSIVNCLQPHPYDCLLASSGLDPLVRIWAPKPEDGPDSKEASEVEDINEVANANQKLMYENPIELALLNMGYRLGADPESSEHAEDLVQCRAS